MTVYLTVDSGYGDGTYNHGQVVTITAYTPTNVTADDNYTAYFTVFGIINMIVMR